MNNLKLNTLSFLLTICCVLQISANDYFYYYKGGKIFLELNTEYIFVSGASRNNVENVNSRSFRNEASVDIFEDETFRRLIQPTGVTNRNASKYYREIALTDNLSNESYIALINQLRMQYNDLIFAPYFKNGANEKIGMSDEFYLRLKKADDFNLLLEVIEEYNLTLVGQNQFMELWYTVELTSSTPYDAMQMSKKLNETGLFKCIEPTFLSDVNINSIISSNNRSVSPNDSYYPLQWYLKNPEQGDDGTRGVDINVEGAWEITKGNNINVAVFDKGIGMHPDLNVNLVGEGYNASAGSAPSIVLGAHGTPCAGIIGAEQNEIGISGVAPECGLISVCFARSLTGTKVHVMTDGINWSWQNGADIISNSWSDNNIKSCMLEEAINNALTKGRGGLGTVVVFSAGNGNKGEVEYPGNSNPLILCVGGIDKCGFRSGESDIITNSCDPIDFKDQASSYGTLLDVVAGGTNILTTDNTKDYFSGKQYNIEGDGIGFDDEKYTYFGGTSAACPTVAGVAALVLSVRPDLTVSQVNDIIEQSAQKISEGKRESNNTNHPNYNNIYNYEYKPNRPNGKWNKYLGYGMVDAYEAVMLAQDYKCEADVQIPSNKNGNNLEISYSSSEEISTTSDDSQNDVDVIINTDEAVYMRSNHIKLNVGFKVESGACLNATIDPCE